MHDALNAQNFDRLTPLTVGYAFICSLFHLIDGHVNN